MNLFLFTYFFGGLTPKLLFLRGNLKTTVNECSSVIDKGKTAAKNNVGFLVRDVHVSNYQQKSAMIRVLCAA